MKYRITALGIKDGLVHAKYVRQNYETDKVTSLFDKETVKEFVKEALERITPEFTGDYDQIVIQSWAFENSDEEVIALNQANESL